ncbi:hypothetical protein H6P81_008040 [Aristolochia fimbriata]|uniref:Root cap n=1 Tax=Aristolochia fimbriata TaxID=158543 RepID=A0AAV7F362_ARIFI|nr:hypothetical protein H6P81_008040 [Aristolochia fimbriata]
MGSRNLVFCIIVLILGMIMAAAVEGADNNKYKYPKKAKCSIGKYKHCYNIEHNCPDSCPGSCVVDCVSCKPICSCDKPGAVCQDPRFIGADGVTFYFHGKKDGDFCLVSDANLHINGHFIGKRNPAMSRDFTWVQSIGILFDDHRIFVGAEKTATWDDSVDRLGLAFDGQRVSLPTTQGATWRSDDGVSFTRSSRATNAVTVEAEGRFKIEAVVVPITEEESRVHGYGIEKSEEEDCMAHLDLAFKFYSLTKDVNGVLGQTYAKDYVSKVKISAAMAVVGGNDKFSTTDLFAPDCAASRFVRGNINIVRVTDQQQHAGLDCSSDLGRGTGIVCKK